MFRWRINCVELQNFYVRSIDNIMFRPGWHYNSITICHLILIVINIDHSLPRLKAEELVTVWMNFHTDFFFWLKSHQDELTIHTSVKYFSEIFILQGVFFYICLVSFFHNILK